MAVLLIGPTGSGKSALGNFLLSKSGGKYFAVAEDGQPKTRFTEVKKKRVNKVKEIVGSGGYSSSSKDLTVIDTPGFKEGSKEDFKHMIGVIETLKNVGNVRACIFVVKFEAKIDKQYKDTIEYYSKLLPSLFSHSIVVMTNCATDERSVETRAQKGINYDDVLENIKKEMANSSGIAFTPMIFAIDSLPGRNGAILTKSKKARDAILSFIFWQKEVPTIDFHVTKTKALLDEDDKDFKGEITEYIQKLEDQKEGSKDKLDAMLQKEQKITDTEKEIIKLEESLKEKNSGDLVTIVWSARDPFSWLKKKEETFDIQSDWEIITKPRKWTNGHSEWEDYEEEARRVHGVLKGEFMRDLHAYIILETKKRSIFATEIDTLSSSLAKAKRKLETAEDEAKRISVESAYIGNATLLKMFLQEKREEIKERTPTILTLEQASLRLRL